MMLDPVVKDSSRDTNPNSAVDHNTSSSASRDRCMAMVASAARCSTRKSRSATASRLLRLIVDNPSNAFDQCGTHEQPRVGGDLVIATPRSVQPSSYLADPRAEG